MQRNDTDQNQAQTDNSQGSYEAPTLTTIGRAKDVILGVSGGGDDLMGYSFPEFEFEPDDETQHE